MEQYKLQQAIDILKILKTDALMALEGTWDCTTQEGIKTGFEAQIELIDEFLNSL